MAFVLHDNATLLAMQLHGLTSTAQIENEAHHAKVIAEADAEYYLAQKTADANKVQVMF